MGYKYIINAVLIFALWTGSIKAQAIKAVIVDSSSYEVLEKATVLLNRLPDSVLVDRILSGREGFLMGADTGHYFLSVSYIGYLTYNKEIKITKADSIYDLGIIALASQAETMTTVVIQSVIPPVIVRSDTIVYNTSGYKTRENASVEDLLRKLPGVQIDKDGSILVNGQKVEKIYIDGKEFLITDPKLATRTLTADMIEAIESFQGGSERSRLTRSKDMEGKQALNLKLKKNKKKGLFGHAYGAYGTEDGYSAGGLAHYFKGDRWLSGQFNMNNISNLYMGTDQKNSREGPGLQKLLNGSLNYRDQWSPTINVNANYAGNNTQNEVMQTTKRQTFFSDSTLLQEQMSQTKNKFNFHFFNAQAEWKIDSLNTLVYSPSFNLQNNNSTTLDTQAVQAKKLTGVSSLNEAFSLNKRKTKSYDLGNRLSYARRFSKEGRYIYAELMQGYNRQEGKGSLQSLTRFYSGTDTIEQKRDQLMEQTGHGQSYGVSLTYAEPLAKGKILDIGYSVNHSKNISDNLAMNYNATTGKYDEPDSLQTNAFKNKSTVQQFSVGYNHIAGKLNYQLGLAAQYTDLNNQSIKGATGYGNIHQRMVNWFPRASLMYGASRRKNLRIQYEGSSQQPSIEQLQPLPDLTNPLLIRIGNPSLRQQFNHNMQIHYSLLKSKSLKSVVMMLGSQVTTNRMVEASTIKQGGVQELQFVNVNGVYSLNSQLMYSFPLSRGGKNGNGSFSSGIYYNRDKSLINYIENVRRGLTLRQSLQFNYNAADKFYFTLNGTLDYNTYNYSIQQDLNTSLLNQNYFLDLSYQLPAGLLASSNMQVMINGSQGSLPGRTITLWNASLAKNLLNNKAEIKLSGFDLLNKNSNFSQTAQENYIETRQGNALKRLFLLSFLYRFNGNMIK